MLVHQIMSLRSGQGSIQREHIGLGAVVVTKPSGGSEMINDQSRSLEGQAGATRSGYAKSKEETQGVEYSHKAKVHQRASVVVIQDSHNTRDKLDLRGRM